MRMLVAQYAAFVTAFDRHLLYLRGGGYISGTVLRLSGGWHRWRGGR